MSSCTKTRHDDLTNFQQVLRQQTRAGLHTSNHVATGMQMTAVQDLSNAERVQMQDQNEAFSTSLTLLQMWLLGGMGGVGWGGRRGGAEHFEYGGKIPLTIPYLCTSSSGRLPHGPGLAVVCLGVLPHWQNCCSPLAQGSGGLEGGGPGLTRDNETGNSKLHPNPENFFDPPLPSHTAESGSELNQLLHTHMQRSPTTTP